MKELFISILEITEENHNVFIREMLNEKLDKKKAVHKYDGFEFMLLSLVDDSFMQILLYAYNTYVPQVLFHSVDNCGKRVGVKLDKAILVETDGEFSGVLCDYIFQISNHPIQANQAYQSIGLERMGSISISNYCKIVEKLRQNEKVDSFSELLHYIEIDNSISLSTQIMVQDTMLYGENYRSINHPMKEGQVCFEENLTLMAAKQFSIDGKRTAVLNFANPVEPGGGVLRGANAQEETICRASNLYKALTSECVKNYYTANNNILRDNQFNSIFVGTDMVIYSPHVMVLKDTMGYIPGFLRNGKEEYNNTPYYVDVITCAAPFFSGSGYVIPNGDLMHIFERRIRNILETAIENDVEVIILGAFGCGAFHNPPSVVANAFRNVLLEKRYATAFDKVVFSVKRSDIICENIEEFEKAFSLFPQINDYGKEKQHRLFWKWECSCGFENEWDRMFCKRCDNSKRNRKKVIMYNS